MEQASDKDSKNLVLNIVHCKLLRESQDNERLGHAESDQQAHVYLLSHVPGLDKNLLVFACCQLVM